MDRRHFAKLALATGGLALMGRRMSAAAPAAWQGVLDQARGQTVYWHAWGGDPKINDFITWVGGLAQERYGVTLEQVKLAATSDAVTRVLAERDAGQTTDGAVDLIWINGENFAAMRRENLLFGPFAEDLPNWALVDVAGKPAVTNDFTQPTMGYESPWAMARLVFEHDSARVAEPPHNLMELADWAATHPGRFTYPQPPDYLGMTFLKQVLYGLLPNPAVLLTPAEGPGYDQAATTLWAFLDGLHPYLWRSAGAFPDSEPALGQLLADAEIDIAFAFNPGRASAEIAAGNLADTIRTFVFEGGTIGNASFLAIPFNAAHQAGAQVIADLILDPLVQARAQDPAVLGFQTVLDVASLPDPDKARFGALDLGVATLPPQAMGPALLEPHASWVTRLAADWAARYGVA